MQAVVPWLAAFAIGAGPPCAATPVHYEPAAPAGAPRTPWIAAGSRFVGHLFYYGEALADSRVYSQRGAVVYVGGRTPAGAAVTKILWVPQARRGLGRSLVLTGRRLDGRGSFSQRFPRVRGPQFPSILRIPTAGCWRLTIRSGRLRAAAVVEAVDATRPDATCRPTAVRTDQNPLSGLGPPWIATVGATRPIFGTLFFSVPAVGGATTYAGGRDLRGASTKILWRTDRGYGRELVIEGRRLDADGDFRQVEPMASSPAGSFPSIVDVPSAGCWLFTVRTGRVAGIAVFRVLPPS